jgi:hypothetical protein
LFVLSAALASDWIMWRGMRVGGTAANWSPQTEFPSSEECQSARPRFAAAAFRLLEADSENYSQVKIDRADKIIARSTKSLPRLNESTPPMYPVLTIWFESGLRERNPDDRSSER